jgi:prepilin-type N-terminal cleavage/methylation domain-containing protein
MIRSPRRAAFTLIEMITVIAIIAILAGLVLAVNGLVQKKSALARADAEVKDLSVALESYKTDNGGYPQDANKTDTLDPRNGSVAADTSSSGKMAQSSLYLYQQLSGDTDGDGTIGNGTDTGKNYAPDFWKPTRLGGTKDATGKVAPVKYIMDPFGNPYGYSTAGLLVEQEYRTALSTDPNAARKAQNSKGTQGYNPTFDLWTCAGDTGGNPAKWVKNW